MTAAPARTEHTVPVTLLRHLVELVQRWHIPPDELLAGYALPKVPADPFARVPLGTMLDLLQRARVLTGEPGLGYYLALEERVSTYGTIGLAASSASSVRGAIDLVIRFAPVFSTAMSIDLTVDGGEAFLRLEENADLGSARDIVLIHMMLGLETMAASLTGRRDHVAAEIAIQEPAYNARFAYLVPRWRFGQPENRIVFGAEALSRPILAADPVSLDLMRAICERSLTDLGFDENFVEQVRRAIVHESGGFRSLDEVAQEMHLSQRTLTRRLAARGTSFWSLVERERRDRALTLLRSPGLSIQTIARRLEYSSASTFVRAFRSWTGSTPAAYRREGMKRRTPQSPR